MCIFNGLQKNECITETSIHPTWLPFNTDDNVFHKDYIIPTASLIIQYLKVTFEVFSAVTVKNNVFCVVTPSRLV